jgi:hypothetical protein
VWLGAIYCAADINVPATCRAASFEVHRANFAKVTLEMTSKILSRRYELMVQQTVDFKEFREHFDCFSYFSVIL